MGFAAVQHAERGQLLARETRRTLHRFIPAAVCGDDHDLLRARILVSISLSFLVILAAVLCVFLFYLPRHDLGYPLVLSIALSLALVLALFRMTGSIAIGGNALALALYLSLIQTCYFYGGLDSPMISAMCIVPVLAGLLAGRRWGFAWCAGVVATWATFFALEQLHAVPPVLHSERYQVSLLVSLAFTGMGISSIVLIYETMNSRLREQLARDRALYEYMAGHDPLTKLPNRRGFFQHLDIALARQGRAKRPLALCVIDLDGFKRVNDELGHPAGDALLRSIAERLRRGLRSHDLSARIGGDEFGVILEDLQLRRDVVTVLDKLLSLIREPCVLREREVSVTASIGVALFPEDADGLEPLVERADSAMYRAKEAGGGYCFADAPRSRG